MPSIQAEKFQRIMAAKQLAMQRCMTVVKIVGRALSNDGKSFELVDNRIHYVDGNRLTRERKDTAFAADELPVDKRVKFAGCDPLENIDKAGELGSRERVEYYRQRAQDEQDLYAAS